MKKIGEGYSYKVYQIDEDRVLKVFKKNYFETVFDLSKSEGFQFLKPFIKILNFKKIAKEYYGKILRTIPLEILGNPIFLNDTDYEQDKVLIFGDGFKNLSIEKSKNFLDSYFEMCVTLWQLGYHDNVYNFSINCGLAKDGRCCMVDFNELLEDFYSVRNEIALKKWQSHYDYSQLEVELKQYFDTKAEAIFSKENLKSNWGSRLIYAK